MTTRIAVLLFCVGCQSGNPSWCGQVTRTTHHAITPAQRATILGADGGLDVNGCQSVCETLDGPRISLNAGCTLGTDGAGDTVDCAYARICR